GDIAAAFIMWFLGFNRINKKYSRFAQFNGREFSTALLKEFGVQYELDDRELENIPQEGPFIFVSNHPYGAIDGMILLNIFSSVRPDIKFVTNFILSNIPNLKDFFFPVNPFENGKDLKSSFSGLRMANEHLATGGCLGLFPAGEVSSHYGSAIIRDKEWQPSIIKLIKNAGVPVIPVYCHGTNSKFFHVVGRIHPVLRTIRLPRELLNKKGRVVSVRIGRVISASEVGDYKDIKSLGRYLKSRSYALEGNVKKEKKWIADKEIVPIALPKNRRALMKEILSLPHNKLLFTTGHYACYFTDFQSIPLMMHELGRRREESFRAIGEGTGKPLDLDSYDEYYKHLILWDKRKSRLVGAYRLGFGKEILKTKGVKGLYSNTLFGYEKPMLDILNQAIELGRSFVVLDYQKETLPLILLIKGLFYSALNNPEIRYLMGPVSISSWYPKFYRSLIIYYLQQNYSVKELEQYIIPKNPFFPDYLRCSVDDLMLNKMESLEKFDRYLMRLSNNEYRLPTLVKKYLKINSRIIKFNVDPDFNYCVDGMVLLDLLQISKQEIINLSKDEPNKEKVYKRFGIAL
ncbi:MAG: GNAT family N-acetyltransferase, partial [Bacteroidales bacterium]|nr:GNAT family N-acetyltransferase [Bacteroidales bacterium]